MRSTRPFRDIAGDIIRDRLARVHDLTWLVNKLRETDGGIGFYPCSRMAREAIDHLNQNAPDVASRIFGVFDQSADLSLPHGIKGYPLKKLRHRQLKTKVKVMVLASNYFWSREEGDLIRKGKWTGPIVPISRMETTIPHDIDVMQRIETICDLLADDKSRMAYLLTWVSRLDNDRGMTSIFAQDSQPEPGAKPAYSNVVGLTETCEAEAQLDLYQLADVRIRPGDVVLDVGAYRGDTAIPFARYTGPGGLVYAFEPVPGNYQYLLENIALNRVANVVSPINAACSDSDAGLNLVTNSTGTPWSFAVEDNGALRSKSVKIDDFVESNGIPRVDFIKIDAEGWEERVINGAAGTITKQRPKMAVCLYHQSNDMLNIPVRLAALSLGKYTIYMRCKQDGPFGLIMYCKEGQ